MQEKRLCDAKGRPLLALDVKQKLPRPHLVWTLSNHAWPQVAPTALDTSENILMCAPTGAGKTNVAMLAILHTLSLYRDAATGGIDVDKFKIIYVAPMKARACAGARLAQWHLELVAVWLISITRACCVCSLVCHRGCGGPCRRHPKHDGVKLCGCLPIFRHWRCGLRSVFTAAGTGG